MVTNWHNMCREVCTSVSRSRLQMIGTADDPIQMDDSRFAGRRKYYMGRVLQGDVDAESEDSDVDVSNLRNHGRRIDGPWMFGPRMAIFLG